MNKPKILRVNKNTQTGDPKSHGYPAYDFRATPDKYARSSIYGKVTQTKKSETRNWQAFKSGDPYKDTRNGKLLTADYGNYVKIKGDVEGETVYEVTAHHKVNTLTVEVGQEVKPGQILAEIGTTGNSTGLHEHKEFRNADNQNIEVEFVNEVTQPTEPMDKKQQIIDAYLGTRPNQPPSDDEINARLQQNKNPVELIRDILGGDGKAREYWLEQWGIDQTDTNWQETAKAYEDTFTRLKDIYGLTPADNTENVLGFALRSQERIKELEKQQEPKTIYKVDGKDFESMLKIGNIRIIIEK